MGTIRLTAVVFMLTLLITFVSAAGVSSPYWRDNPLKLSPGESTIVTLSLQNMVGEGDIYFKATKSGSEIISLVDSDTDFFVPFGTSDVPVKLLIKIPEDAKVGDVYTGSVYFQQVSSGEGGMLRLASGVSTDIPVEVVGEQESALYGKTPQKSNTIWIVLALVVVGIVAFVVRMSKKRQ